MEIKRTVTITIPVEIDLKMFSQSMNDKISIDEMVSFAVCAAYQNMLPDDCDKRLYLRRSSQIDYRESVGKK